MLINYSFSNFRSFKNRTSLSMLAGTQTTMNENLIRQDGYRIIPSVVIYGANASGKSNIIMSLAVMKEIILAGSLESNVPNLNNLEMCPFAHSDDKKAMSFEIEFTNKGYHLIYGFEVLCSLFKKDVRRILSENLSIVDNKSKKSNQVKLFARNSDGVIIMKDKEALNIIEFDEKLLGEFEKKINSNLDDT